jgi:hypothetical protein
VRETARDRERRSEFDHAIVLGAGTDPSIQGLAREIDVAPTCRDHVRRVQHQRLKLGDSIVDLKTRDEAVDLGIAASRRPGDKPAKRVHRGQAKQPRPDLTALQGEAQIAGERIGEVPRRPAARLQVKDEVEFAAERHLGLQLSPGIAQFEVISLRLEPPSRRRRPHVHFRVDLRVTANNIEPQRC